MSAILKALRKVEQDSSGEVRVQSLSKKLDPRKVIRQRARKAWILIRLVNVLVPALVLAVLIVLGIALKPFLPGGRFFFSNPSQVHGGEEKAKESSAPEQRAGLRQAPESPLQERIAPSGNAGVQSSNASAIAQDRPPASGESSGAGTPSKAIGKHSLQAETSPQAEAGPALELQAIVWSDDPASIFAVINGRIVRSGGMVDGVSIVEIREEAVSLKLGDRTWTLRILEGD